MSAPSSGLTSPPESQSLRVCSTPKLGASDGPASFIFRARPVCARGARSRGPSAVGLAFPPAPSWARNW